MFEPRLFAVIFFRFVFLCQRKRGGVVVGEGGGCAGALIRAEVGQPGTLT